MVKLHFNGLWRRVIIDDRLPATSDRQLLCSHTETTGELWVSLIEKASVRHARTTAVPSIGWHERLLALPRLKPCPAAGAWCLRADTLVVGADGALRHAYYRRI